MWQLLEGGERVFVRELDSTNKALKAAPQLTERSGD